MKQLAHALEKAGLAGSHVERALAKVQRFTGPVQPTHDINTVRHVKRLDKLEKLPRPRLPPHQREHSHRVKGPYGFLTGQYALDVATLARIGVQSLSYRQGESPTLAPWALRYSPDDAYIDLDRLEWWDKWAVMWSRVGAHYYQERWSEEQWEGKG